MALGLNPNPGGLVANMTSKTQNCCDKFIIHQKSFEKFIILHKVLCLILYEQVFTPMMSCLIILSKRLDLC